MPEPVEAIRQQMPVTRQYAYLNTGSYGPLSCAAADAIAAENRRQVTEGRIGQAAHDRSRAMGPALRAAFARLLGCTAEEIALTHHTTDGMNIATWGRRWRPGDEIVTTSLDHPGGLLPVYAVARRYDLGVRVLSLGPEDDRASILRKFEAAIGPHTRFVSIAHVSWKTGAVLPVAEIAEMAHSHGSLIAIDGAQSAGAIPIDVHTLGVDFYAIPGQKWLCGPSGVGALYVRRERLGDLLQTYVGYSSMRDGGAFDETGVFLPAPGAKRYEVGTVYKPALAGMLAGLRWFEELGYGWVFERVQQITRHTRRRLAGLPGVRLVANGRHAGLTSFTLDGVEPAQVVEALARQQVLLRSVPDPDLIRVSTSFFNNEADVERLCSGIDALVNPR